MYGLYIDEIRQPYTAPTASIAIGKLQALAKDFKRHQYKVRRDRLSLLVMKRQGDRMVKLFYIHFRSEE